MSVGCTAQHIYAEICKGAPTYWSELLRKLVEAAGSAPRVRRPDPKGLYERSLPFDLILAGPGRRGPARTSLIDFPLPAPGGSLRGSPLHDAHIRAHGRGTAERG